MSEETVKQSFTVSFHHGTDVALNHNRRTESLVEKESHIDPDGIHETWTDEPIGTAYRRIFGEALEEYNKKQKRKDRRIDDYLANVRGNSKLNDRYEFIAQVGNEKQHPDEPTAREILKEYHEDFIKRNGIQYNEPYDRDNPALSEPQARLDAATLALCAALKRRQ